MQIKLHGWLRCSSRESGSSEIGLKLKTQTNMKVSTLPLNQGLTSFKEKWNIFGQ